MYPPVPAVFRQAVGSDIFMDKYHIPPGTQITIALFAMMRSVKCICVVVIIMYNVSLKNIYLNYLS